MKKIITFLMIFGFAFVLMSCEDPIEYEFSIEAENETVEVGKNITIYADTNKPSPKFKFSSSDEAIASVDEVGSVTGVTPGLVTITVELEEVGKLDVEITVIEKNLTSNELKVLLKAVLTEYQAAKNGSLKVTANDGVETMVSETIFNYSATGALESLMYKVEIDEELHVYVKDGVSYMLANGSKTKKDLTAQEESTIKLSYGHSVFLDPLTKFYNEDKFYEALVFSKKTATGSEFLLDTTLYTGTVFNTADVDEIKIIVSFTNSKVSKVEVQTKAGTISKFIIVEYRGTAVQTISYPTDLESYGG